MELLAATLTIEDLHWADPKTPDVLRGIAGRGALAPLFIVATNPARVPPWDMRAHHMTLSLVPRRRDMIVELSAGHALRARWRTMRMAAACRCSSRSRQ